MKLIELGANAGVVGACADPGPIRFQLGVIALEDLSGFLDRLPYPLKATPVAQEQY